MVYILCKLKDIIFRHFIFILIVDQNEEPEQDLCTEEGWKAGACTL